MKEIGEGRVGARMRETAEDPNEGTAGATRVDITRGTIEVMAVATGTTNEGMAGPTVEGLIARPSGPGTSIAS